MTERHRTKGAMSGQRHPAWWAFVLHRISGVALAVFLPLHFLLLGSALGGVESLDMNLAWTDNILFKIAEYGLAGLLAVHITGGVRVMLIEGFALTGGQKNWLAAALCIGLMTAVAVALSAGV